MDKMMAGVPAAVVESCMCQNHLRVYQTVDPCLHSLWLSSEPALLLTIQGVTDANDARTLTKATICYRLPGRLLERSVIGPEYSRNDQKTPSLQGKKKYSRSRERCEGLIQGQEKNREYQTVQGYQRQNQDDLSSGEENNKKYEQQEKKSTYIYQNKAVKPVIILRIRVKRSEGQK